MITLSSLLQCVRKNFPGKVHVCYVHPTLYVVCEDAAFSKLGEEERANYFAQKTGLPADVNLSPSLASNLSILLITPDERVHEYDFLSESTIGSHWLPLLDPDTLASQNKSPVSVPSAIHFYGFKGGQARTTVLAMLSKFLADDGYSVLAVDADVEAPSLDVLLNVAANSPHQTLMGLLDPTSEIEPLSAYTSANGEGRVDLLACRPSAREYDMDFAAFALRTALDVTSLQRGLINLVRSLKNRKKGYDVILFDHRSGIATSVLPIMSACPGPTVVCLRIDEQSSNAIPVFEILFNQASALPGAYVSFSLDPDETRESMLGSKGARIHHLLDTLGSAIEKGSTQYASSGEDLPPEDFLRYWVSWFHDRAFINDPLPPLATISESNRQSLRQLREVLALSGPKTERKQNRSKAPTPSPKRLSPSGAGDEGIFIETREIARLFQPNTSISYIFGRKGTGKTRLLRELKNRGLGEPLLVAADAKDGGLATSDTLFQDLANSFSSDPEKLWWCIVGAALESDNTNDKKFHSKLKEWERKAKSRKGLRITEIGEIASALPVRRVFLIDGIETAFRAASLIDFVEALFKVTLTIQSSAHFADKLVIRLFLRTDLAKRAIQNVEQQTAGRRLELSWNTQSIFNFVLSRIEQLSWFRQHFPTTCETIASQIDKVKSGLLVANEYEALLLEVFPRHMRRNNLQTLTFLKTYFSDAAGDDEIRASFYPRLFDAFLHLIAHSSELPHGLAPERSLEDGHVNQSLVLASHDAASRKFLDEVKQELSVLLSLAKSPADNEQRVSQLLSAFDGLTTPFVLEDCLKKLAILLPKFGKQNLRDALSRMKEIGMFEDRPGFSGWWRAGRLFKSALRMKYVRK